MRLLGLLLLLASSVVTSSVYAQEEIQVVDFNAYRAGTTTNYPPATLTPGKPLTVLGFFPLMPTGAARAYFTKELSNTGYTSFEQTTFDSCLGKVVRGVTSKYVAEIHYRKVSDAVEEEVKLDTSAPYNPSVVLRVVRQIRFKQEPGAPVSDWLPEILSRYGTPEQSTSIKGGKYPATLAWFGDYNRSLVITIRYSEKDPEKIASVEFLNSLSKETYDKAKQPSEELCRNTRVLDEKKQQEIEARTKAAPKL